MGHKQKSSSKSRRDYCYVSQRLWNIGASGMVHKLSRRECASMADADDADLRFWVSVQEPMNCFPIRPVSGGGHIRHLGLVGILGLGFGRLHLGFLQWSRSRSFVGWDGFGNWNWFCNFLCGFYFGLNQFLITLGMRFNWGRGSGVVRLGFGLSCNWTIQMARMAYCITACPTWIFQETPKSEPILKFNQKQKLMEKLDTCNCVPSWEAVL